MRIPVAMYGIQFNPSFDFQAARGIIPYIAELGMKDYIKKQVIEGRETLLICEALKDFPVAPLMSEEE